MQPRICCSNERYQVAAGTEIVPVAARVATVAARATSVEVWANTVAATVDGAGEERSASHL